MLTGIFAAELLVKKAYIPLSFNVLITNGYGLVLVQIHTMNGFTTRAIKNIVPTNTSNSLP